MNFNDYMRACFLNTRFLSLFYPDLPNDVPELI